MCSVDQEKVKRDSEQQSKNQDKSAEHQEKAVKRSDDKKPEQAVQNPKAEAVNVTGTFNVCFSCFSLFWSIFSVILIPKLISTLYFILAKQSPPGDFRFGKKRQHLQLQCKKILLIQYAQACLRAGLSLTGSVFSFSQQFRIRFGSEAEGLYSLKFHYCRNSEPGFNEPYSFAVS